MQFSASKSITSVLVGIALKEGKIQSIDQPVLDFFPNAAIANLTETKKKIHIHDLLNMTSGLTSDDTQMGESPDWSQFTLNQPMAVEPGTEFDYNTGNTQLLSAILQKTTGKTAFEYAKEKLFKPLEIQDVYWASEPSGETQGGVGLMLTPRDMLKIGFLYLHKGKWKDKQIVPSEWVEASTQKNNNGYAYQWWQSPNGYCALGYGGQVIYVIPSKDMVVVSTAGMMEDQLFAITAVDTIVVNASKSDQPIPESPSTKALSDRIAEIANPQAHGFTVSPSPEVLSQVNGKTLLLDENPLGWKTAKLVFDSQQALLSITTSSTSTEQQFIIGMDGLYRETWQKKAGTLKIAKPKQRYILNPYEFNFLLGMPVDGSVAMKGEWAGKDKFVLTVQDTRDFDLDKLTFIFTPPDATISLVSTMDATLLKLTGKFQ